MSRGLTWLALKILASIALGGCAATPTAETPTLLTNGVSLVVSGAQGSSSVFQISIPAGSTNLRFSIQSVSEVELYMRLGSAPALSSFDLKSAMPGGNQTLSLPSGGPGAYYLMVYGRAAYSSARITASFTPPARTQTEVLALAVPSLSGQAGKTVNLTMRFNAVPMVEDYMVFVHFIDSSGAIAFGGDHAPSKPTSTWNGAISYSRSVQIPASAASGSYSIRVGLYQNHSPWGRATLQPGAGVTDDGQLRYTVGSLAVSSSPSPSPSPTATTPPGVSTGIAYPGTLTGLRDSGPIAISGQNGTVISGLRISNPNGPCISVSNSQNIQIRDNEIGPCRIGILINGGSGHQIIHNYIHHTVTWDSSYRGNFDGPGIKTAGGVSNVTIRYNYLEHVTSGYLSWGGTGLVFDRNHVKDVHGNNDRSVIDRIGGQMVQIGDGGTGIRITCNVSDQSSGRVYTEDHVNLYHSKGTAANPILVAYNKVRGYGPSESNGGLVAGDGQGDYIRIERNNVIHVGGYGVGIAGGYGNALIGNKVFGQISFYWAKGVHVKDFSGTPNFGGHSVLNNKVYYFASGGGGEDINYSATTVSGNLFSRTTSPTDVFGDGSRWTEESLWNESFPECSN